MGKISSHAAIFVAVLAVVSQASDAPTHSTPSTAALFDSAKVSLEANIETIGNKQYLTAGRHQFKSFWSRDFCYSVRGLLDLGHFDLVRNQLDLLLDHKRNGDSLIPRTLDSSSAQWRVVQTVMAYSLGMTVVDVPITGDLKPEYVSENKSEAIDSNLLVLLAAVSYLDATGDQVWWNSRQSDLLQVYRYYDSRKDGALITQPPFSDWQDSVRRQGKTFLTNLLYWKVSNELSRFPLFEITQNNINQIQGQIESEMWDPNTSMYRSVAGAPQISLDGNLLALDLGYLKGDRALELFRAIRRSPLWTGDAGPGFDTFPDYSVKDISAWSQIVGLRHYHDRMYWSWLLGLSLKTAKRFGDLESAEKITLTLERIVARDGSVVEIYAPTPELAPWSSHFLEAERPFSWGSAFVLDALMYSGPGGL